MSHSIKIVFVHGWGMNSAVWGHCIENLPDWIQVASVDLPGHGTMAGKDVDAFEDMVKFVAAAASGPVIWVGWSLGGLVCLKLAELYPEKVKALCLVATNPCFVKREDWSSAIEKSVFDEFSLALKNDIDKTIKRFLALQVAGSKTTLSTIKKLQTALQERGNASDKALDLGLEILSQVDLRDCVKHLKSPTQWILGAKDSLVPVALAESLASLSPQNDVVIFDEAAHAPFVSQPDTFNETLIQFSSGLR